MTLESWLPILNKIQRFLTCFGMTVNTILIPIILLRSPKELGLYKFMMVYISFFEIFFGAVELLTLPDFLTKDSAFFVMVDPRKTILPQSFIQAANLLFCGSFGVSLGIFSFQFGYRYQVLRGNICWTATTFRNVVFWLASPIVFASIWSAAIGVFMRINDYAKTVLIRESTYPPELDLDTIGFCGALFYPKLDDGSEVINWDSMIGVSVTSTILVSLESAMVFFAFKCFQTTRSLMNTSNHSKSFNRLQWQLFYALVLQTLVPIFFIQGPFSLIYLTTLVLDNCTEGFGHFLALSITLYLALDAFPTIIIIKQYRDTVLAVFKKMKIIKVQPVNENGVGSVTSARNLKI